MFNKLIESSKNEEQEPLVDENENELSDKEVRASLKYNPIRWILIIIIMKKKRKNCILC